jgi:ketosteroid isomerase-like protein
MFPIRHFRSSPLVVGVIIGSTSWAAPQGNAQQPGLGAAGYAAARAQLLAADSALARVIHSKGEGPGFSSTVADDALYLEPGADHVRGKRRIGTFLSTRSTKRKLSIRPAVGEISADASVGYTVGWTTLTDSAAATPQYGKYIAFWRRRPDGAWQLEVWNRSRAAEPPPSTPALPTGQHQGTAQLRALDPVTATRQMRSADSAFAALSVARGAAPAFYQYAAPQAIALGSGKDFVIGPEAIRDDQAAGAVAGQTLDWKPVAGGAGASGDLGWTVGEFRFTAPQEGKTLTVAGKYLTIWRRMPDGSWRYVADGGSGSAAPKS